MRRRGVWRWLLGLAVLGIGMAGPVTGMAQSSPPEAAGHADASGRAFVAGVGAVIGTIVYAPFKALVLCPLSAVGSGATYAATAGREADAADYVLRVGCTGTYVVSPDMVQGREPFRAYDER